MLANPTIESDIDAFASSQEYASCLAFGLRNISEPISFSTHDRSGWLTVTRLQAPTRLFRPLLASCKAPNIDYAEVRYFKFTEKVGRR